MRVALFCSVIVLVVVIYCWFVFETPRAAVLTARFDNSRSNANRREYILTPTKVAAGRLGKLGNFAVDGPVLAQPLFVPSVSISGGGEYDLLIVATMNDSVYAFDANNANSSPLWKTSLGVAWRYPNYPHRQGEGLEYEASIGCVSTPVIEAAASRIYVVCADDTPKWTLEELDLTTGRILKTVEIEGSVKGSGDPLGDNVDGPNLLFSSSQHVQRSALTLANGRIYVAFASQTDMRPWHGWIFAYDLNSLALAAVVCTTPEGFGGGVWTGGGGLSVDAAGSLYATTGNGDWDGVKNFSQSILRFDRDLKLMDWFTPSIWASMNAVDSDLGSEPAILIPGDKKLVTASKNYLIFSVDSTCLGHIGASECPPPQIFSTSLPALTAHSGVYNGLFFGRSAFFANAPGSIFRFDFHPNGFDPKPLASRAIYEFPGAQMAASSNGDRDGIVWAVTSSASALVSRVDGTLRAFSPSDLSEYWNSDMKRRDHLGALSKFATPTVVNGHVYVATQSGYVAAYGLLP